MMQIHQKITIEKVKEFLRAYKWFAKIPPHKIHYPLLIINVAGKMSNQERRPKSELI